MLTIPMKKLLLTTCILLVLVNAAAAMKKAEGYYISAKTGRKYTTTFLIPSTFLSSKPNYVRMQKEIFYLTEGEKQILTAEKVSEVSFTYKNKTILMRPVYNNLARIYQDEPVFFNVLVDGAVILYTYTEANQSAIAAAPGTGGGVIVVGVPPKYIPLVLQREGRELVRIRSLFFKKDVCGFFADCPDLVKKIQDGKLSELPEIVKVYNETCLELSK
jgi:hypothetical protein